MNQTIKKTISAVLALSLILGGCGAATPSASAIAKTPAPPAPATSTVVPFTDSLDRVTELSTSITRVAPCGSVAQMILYTLAPELLIGWAANPSETTKKYIPEEYWKLPEFGQFYGKNVSLNMEALVAADPQVIIDMGDIKPGMVADLDGLTQQLAVPVIFIEATLETMPQAYRTLGKLLNKGQKAEELALYCEKTLKMAADFRAKVGDKKQSVYFGTGKDGLACNARGSIHSTVLDMLGIENAAVVENVSNKGGGNQIDMEQLLNFNPQVMILQAPGVYDQVATDPTWQQLEAVKSGRYYEIPNAPYDFMSAPPSVNRMIGLNWLARLVSPESYTLDFTAELKEFYKLFYGYALTDDETTTMLANSIGK